MHTLMDLRGFILTFVLLTPGKVNDVKVIDKIPVERNSFYLIDKGYVAFEKLYNGFQKVSAYFVTRAKDNMVYEVVESRPIDKHSGGAFRRDHSVDWILHVQKVPGCHKVGCV